MPRLPIYQVDAFADRPFQGNPAAVVPLREWLPDDTLQRIANENNLSETAFFVPLLNDADAEFHLRWFTPTMEVDLCGHATLASGYVVLTELDREASEVRFRTRSGVLRVERKAERVTTELPARPPEPCEPLADAAGIFGAEPETLMFAHDAYLAVYESERVVRALRPDIPRLAATGHCLIATAPGTETDFVSRYFAPAHGVDEDPVTGAAHTVLVPYWSKRLELARLSAYQASTRGGRLDCENHGDRVRLTGNCSLYLQGTIHVPD